MPVSWYGSQEASVAEQSYVSGSDPRSPSAAVQRQRRVGHRRAYRMHRVSPHLSAREAERLRAAANQVVVDPLDEWTCAGFATSGGGLLLMLDDEPHCLRCSGLDHLVFL